jgi:hypothetical protein
VAGICATRPTVADRSNTKQLNRSAPLSHFVCRRGRNLIRELSPAARISSGADKRHSCKAECISGANNTDRAYTGLHLADM